ncbi:hypothetical protein [Hungatella effluvii]|jgi:DNA-binding CsgD family transcriptional regulator|uniref:hypothetical protein n=1 Tax=Hungatella effluvii TaxID=1096246 RepID=UPI0022E3851D|nr:hypothetical protein [Hungatella effluvii]
MMTKINADNLKYLTLKQKKAAILMLEGRSYVEISKILGCSKQNVSQLLKSASNQVEIKSSSKQMFIPSLKRQEKITIKKQEEVRRKQESARKRQKEAQLYRKERYLGKSLSVLTPAESRVFLLWLDGFTYREIGEKLQVSAGIGTLLNHARKKLDGTYEETRQQINLRRKEYRKRHKEDSEIQHKLKSREQRLSEMREYNKRYYQAHREEILSRRKSKKNVPKV